MIAGSTGAMLRFEEGEERTAQTNYLDPGVAGIRAGQALS